MSSDPSKRTLGTDRRGSLAQLSSAEFVSTFMDYLNDPQVTVTVEDKTFVLPKKLLCGRSPFFDRAFNSGFQEGIEQAVKLEDTDVSTFEHIIRWMIIGCANFPDPEANNGGEAAKYISRYVKYFVLADILDLGVDFEPDILKLKEVLKEHQGKLSAEHIRSAANLPKYHCLRVLFAQACAQEYLLGLRSSTPFRFQAEMDELEGFASDLIKAFHCAAKGKVCGQMMCKECGEDTFVSLYDLFPVLRYDLLEPDELASDV